jgi:mRNA export factor
MSAFGALSSSTTAQPDKDVEVGELPNDSISSISFSPQADYMAIGSWNNEVNSRS